MSKKAAQLHRRRFLKSAATAAGAAVLAPTIIPSSALGLDGAVPPSERIVVGGIGIGNRGKYDLGCFLEQPDVQFAGRLRRQGSPSHRDQETCRRKVRKSKLQNVSRFSRTARSIGYRCGADRHRSQLACHGGHDRRQGRQGSVLRKTVYEEHRSEFGPGRNDAPHGPRVPGRYAATQSAPLCVCMRVGPERSARQAQESVCPSGRHAGYDQRLAVAGEGTGQGSGRLGYVSGACCVAAVQSQAAGRFQFRKRGRPGRRRRVGMGLALRRSLPMGPWPIVRRRCSTTRRKTASWWPSIKTASS